MKTDPNKVSLRPFALSDRERIFQWRNSPFLIKLGSSGRSVTWDEHCRWFDGVLNSDDHTGLMVYLEDDPVGQIRFDLTEPGIYAVSIYLAEEFIGRGIGTIALGKAVNHMCRQEANAAIVALVRNGNIESKNMFSKVGFEELDGYPSLPADHFAMKYSPCETNS